RWMFAIYYLAAGLVVLYTFKVSHPPETRLYLCGLIGLTVFGVFGSFTYYLPELFPTRLRATGAGFCYNVGRILAAGGPLWVGTVAARGSSTVLETVAAIGYVPLIGLLLVPLAIETKGRELA